VTRWCGSGEIVPEPFVRLRNASGALALGRGLEKLSSRRGRRAVRIPVFPGRVKGLFSAGEFGGEQASSARGGGLWEFRADAGFVGEGARPSAPPRESFFQPRPVLAPQLLPQAYKWSVTISSTPHHLVTPLVPLRPKRMVPPPSVLSGRSVGKIETIHVRISFAILALKLSGSRQQ